MILKKNGSKPRQQSAPSDTFPPREWRSNPSTLTPRQRARPSPDPWHHSVARFRWPSPRGTRTSTRRTTTLATSRGAPSSATFSRRRLSRVSNEKSSRGPDPCKRPSPSRRIPTTGGPQSRRTRRAPTLSRVRPARAKSDRHTRPIRPEPEKGFGRPSLTTSRGFSRFAS